MAVTKILARKGGLNDAIRYVVNGDKTNDQTLTAYLNCDPGHAARQMQDTKESVKKTDGVQYYHMILSFKPGKATPELALQIAKEFAEEHLLGFETVVRVHVDRKHVHAQLLWTLRECGHRGKVSQQHQELLSTGSRRLRPPVPETRPVRYHKPGRISNPNP